MCQPRVATAPAAVAARPCRPGACSRDESQRGAARLAAQRERGAGRGSRRPSAGCCRGGGAGHRGARLPATAWRPAASACTVHRPSWTAVTARAASLACRATLRILKRSSAQAATTRCPSSEARGGVTQGGEGAGEGQGNSAWRGVAGRCALASPVPPALPVRVDCSPPPLPHPPSQGLVSPASVRSGPGRARRARRGGQGGAALGRFDQAV